MSASLFIHRRCAFAVSSSSSREENGRGGLAGCWCYSVGLWLRRPETRTEFLLTVRFRFFPALRELLVELFDLENCKVRVSWLEGVGLSVAASLLEKVEGGAVVRSCEGRATLRE